MVWSPRKLENSLTTTAFLALGQCMHYTLVFPFCNWHGHFWHSLWTQYNRPMHHFLGGGLNSDISRSSCNSCKRTLAHRLTMITVTFLLEIFTLVLLDIYFLVTMVKHILFILVRRSIILAIIGQLQIIVLNLISLSRTCKHIRGKGICSDHLRCEVRLWLVR